MSWYAASRQDLRAAIHFLEVVRQDFERSGRLREEWKDPLDKTFGIGCFELLTKWPSTSKDAILLANHLDKHSKTFRKPLPHLGDKDITQVVVDPNQALEMVDKLIAEKLQHLHDLHYSWNQRGSEAVGDANAPPVDFAPRYFTTASRDLHRAVEWYERLKENKL